jgi:dipeptidyl-peptidase-3
LHCLQVLGNLVNYKTFGFTKILPRLPADKFEAVVSKSANASVALPLWNNVSPVLYTNKSRLTLLFAKHQLKDHIYASEPESSLFIGKRSQGHVSNYYLGEVITDTEVAAVQAAAEKLNIDILNTRVVKNGKDEYTLLVGSADTGADAVHNVEAEKGKIKLTVKYGDYSKDLAKAVEALKEVNMNNNPQFRVNS